jgi:hypothetical protein
MRLAVATAIAVLAGIGVFAQSGAPITREYAAVNGVRPHYART